MHLCEIEKNEKTPRLDVSYLVSEDAVTRSYNEEQAIKKENVNGPNDLEENKNYPAAIFIWRDKKYLLILEPDSGGVKYYPVNAYAVTGIDSEGKFIITNEGVNKEVLEKVVYVKHLLLQVFTFWIDSFSTFI